MSANELSHMARSSTETVYRYSKRKNLETVGFYTFYNWKGFLFRILQRGLGMRLSRNGMNVAREAWPGTPPSPPNFKVDM